MQCLHVPQFADRSDADLLLLPFWEGEEEAVLALEQPTSSEIKSAIHAPIALGDFRGKEGESLVVYTSPEPGTKLESRILLLGLGKKEKHTEFTLRRAYAKGLKKALGCSSKREPIAKVNIPLPHILCSTDSSKGKAAARMTELIMSGLIQVHYTFDELKSSQDSSQESSKEPSRTEGFTSVCFIGEGDDVVSTADFMLKVLKGVNFTRDLVNGNADTITPTYLAACAKEMDSTFSSIKTKVLSREEAEEESMGLFLAVARGSYEPPALITMTYSGGNAHKKKSAKKGEKPPFHPVLIGKGVTYDTGGLNLKPTGSMETMKADMTGGATLFGLIWTAALLELPFSFSVVIPATENGIDGNSFKPGDVYVSASGKTVEITNTDAEGRLVLADALTYAQEHLSPSHLIDIATLTGAVEVALGFDRAGLFSNDENLANLLFAVGEKTGDRVWELPMDPEYREYLSSDIADIKNCHKRAGSAITAAKFLEEFVEDLPWAHLDIAAVGYIDKRQGLYSTPASGFGVHLLLEALITLHEGA